MLKDWGKPKTPKGLSNKWKSNRRARAINKKLNVNKNNATRSAATERVLLPSPFPFCSGMCPYARWGCQVATDVGRDVLILTLEIIQATLLSRCASKPTIIGCLFSGWRHVAVSLVRRRTLDFRFFFLILFILFHFFPPSQALWPFRVQNSR